MRLQRKFGILLAAIVLSTLFLGVGDAAASYLVTRNAKNVELKVDAKGRAFVYYTRNGKRYHTMFWGAINAKPPKKGQKQVAFKKDYSGGWGAFRKRLWKTVKDVCNPYDGPDLPWFVTACKAPDGSYWALQSWQRMLPNLGITPWKSSQKVWELHLSHWKGPLPKLEIYLDWVTSKKRHHLFGRFTYKGKPVHGFAATRSGNPLDAYGRNIFLDTHNSAYGPGWKRENSFLTHPPNGNFCYGFYKHDPYPGYPNVGRRPFGHGDRYRATARGPGVTPVVMWQAEGLPDYNKQNPEHVAYERKMNALGDTFNVGDVSQTGCRQH